MFGIVIVAALVMGIYPKPILDRSEKSVQAFLTSYRDRLQDVAAQPRGARAPVPADRGGGVGATGGSAAPLPEARNELQLRPDPRRTRRC